MKIILLMPFSPNKINTFQQTSRGTGDKHNAYDSHPPPQAHTEICQLNEQDKNTKCTCGM